VSATLPTWRIPATKIESMRPIAEIVEQIRALLPPNNGVNRSRANDLYRCLSVTCAAQLRRALGAS
jgi:hypothetical protein